MTAQTASPSSRFTARAALGALLLLVALVLPVVLPLFQVTLLTNVMIYLVSDTFATSTWLYRGLFEDFSGTPVPPKSRIEKPVGIAAFPIDLIPFPPRSLVERHLNVAHWTDMAEGGHFAALEKPDLLVADIVAFARAIGY